LSFSLVVECSTEFATPRAKTLIRTGITQPTTLPILTVVELEGQAIPILLFWSINSTLDEYDTFLKYVQSRV